MGNTGSSGSEHNAQRKQHWRPALLQHPLAGVLPRRLSTRRMAAAQSDLHRRTATGHSPSSDRAHKAMVDLTQQKTRLGDAAVHRQCHQSDAPSARGLSHLGSLERRFSGGPRTRFATTAGYRRSPQNDPKAGQVQCTDIPTAIGGNPINDQPPLKAPTFARRSMRSFPPALITFSVTKRVSRLRPRKTRRWKTTSWR